MIYFLICGLVVGALARTIVGRHTPGGWITSLVIGIAGSFLAGFLGQFLGFYRQGEPVGFIMSLFGAMLVVAIYHWATRKTARL